MTKNNITKVRNQFKSSSYYLFWGTATVAVVLGQIYVGSGYRRMADSLDAWFGKTVDIMIKNKTKLDLLREYYPRMQDMDDDPMVIR